MLSIKRTLPLAILVSVGWIGCDTKTSETLKTSDIPDNGILPLSRSGTNQYPASHSVFADNTQGNKSNSYHPPDGLDFNNYLDNLLDQDYRRANYGNEYMRLLSYQIKVGGINQSIEKALVEATNKLNARALSDHNPVYRLSKNLDINARSKDFEVLVITGTGSSEPGYSPNDSKRFEFDAAMLGHSIRRTYGTVCRAFQVLNDPDKSELEAAIIARTQSARTNKRKLYIVYKGHSTHDGYQEGVAESDYRLEGSKKFVFGLGKITKGFNEYDYKKLLNLYASDIQVTSIILGCYSGAAVTAIDSVIERRYV